MGVLDRNRRRGKRPSMDAQLMPAVEVEKRLAYFQKNGKEAFRQGFAPKLGDMLLGENIYEVFKFYIPRQLSKRVRFLQRYFQTLDKQVEIEDMKRRHHWEEFAETAVSILNRMNTFMNSSHTPIVGSPLLSPVPWAAFGPTERLTKHTFKSLEDIGKHYANYLHGPCYPKDVYFRY